MENQNNLLGILGTLYKWRKRLMAIVAIAFIGSIIVSLMLPNYYKAKTKFYAASTDLVKPDKVFGHNKGTTNYYGDDDERNRVMTLAYSEELSLFLIDSFDLYTHFDIDSTLEKSEFKILEKFYKQFNIQETKHGSMELTIENKDRILARDLANAATLKINKMGQELNKVSQENMIAIIKKNMKVNSVKLKTIGDSLVTLRKQYGIYNIESQSELIASLVATSESSLAKKEAELDYLLKNKSYASQDSIVKLTGKIKGLKQVMNNLTSSESTSNFNLKRFNDGIASVEVLANIHGRTRNSYSLESSTLMEYESLFNSDVPSLHIISMAKTPNIKSKPHRSIIVLAATFAAFVFGCLGILLFESYQRFDWDLIKDAESK